MSARQPLFCPFLNCNRSSGSGFTRRENLEEHKRRRHLGESIDSPVPTTPRKRRIQDTTEDDDNDDDDDEEDAASDSSSKERVIKQLKDDIRHKDDIISLQAAELTRLQRLLRPSSPRAPVTTA
jgi:hypothetical protein